MKQIAAIVGVILVALVGWVMGNDYQKVASHEKFAEMLTSQPLGSETVGLKPLKDPVVLKEILVSINGIERRFVVGEIKKFEVKRYDASSELVLDSQNTAVAEVVRKQ